MTTQRFPYQCKNYGQGRQDWKEIEWRVGDFPLIDEKVTHYEIAQFWEGLGLQFPPDSNCQMCFWKHEMQLRKNFDDSPAVMQWAKNLEQEMGNRFRHKMDMATIEKIAPQLDFFYGTGSGCQAGFCTD